VSGTVDLSTAIDCGSAPTGTVTVSDGQGNTCAANLEADGSWECTMASDSQSVTQLTANYEGDENYIGSTDDTYGLSVDPRNSQVSITGPASACAGEAVTLTAQVTDATAVPGSPPFVGIVSWDDGPASGTFSPVTAICTVNTSGTCSVSYTPAPDDAGETVSISATYDVGDTDPNYATSAAATHSLSVTERTIMVSITCQPATVYINETTNITVTITDQGCGEAKTPTGNITLSLDAIGSQTGTWTNKTGSTSTGTYTATYTPTRNDTADDESHLIKVEFEGTGDFDGTNATGTFPLDVNKREVKVTLAPTVSAAFVDQVVDVDVLLQDDTPGTSDSPCCLIYVISPDDVVVLDDLSSAGGFDSSLTGTFTEQGPVNYACPGPGSSEGTYSFDFYYKPTAGGTGTTTLQATYPGNDLYKAASGSTTLTVETRPTATSVTCNPASVVVDERSTVTINVSDLGPTASALSPEGVLYLSTSGDGNFYASDASTSAPFIYTDTTPIAQIPLVASDNGTVDVYYEADTAAAAREDHVLKADYVATGSPADATTQVHEDSSGSASLTVKLRKTELRIGPGAELVYSTAPMSSGITATVEDVITEGESSSPGGTLKLEAPSGGGTTAGTINVTSTDPAGATIVHNNTSEVEIIWPTFVAGETTVSAGATYNLVEKLQLVHPIIGTFLPDDGKHLASAYATNRDDVTVIEVKIAQANYPVGPPTGGTESDGTGEVISCGLIGGTTADELFKFGTMHQTYVDLMKFMDMAATIIQLFPDVIIDVTDPAWSLIHTAFQGLVLDLDGDGILGVYELAYIWDITSAGGPLTDFTPDSDGDGIWDGTEIALAGGNYYPTILDTSYSWSRPNPPPPPSPREGINAGDE